MKVILASRSPRRKKALRKIVARFRTLAAKEPKKTKGKTLAAKTRYLALAKAKAASHRCPSSIIIAADTLAKCKGKILGKPSSRRAAEPMLKLLSGHRMAAVTSIAVYLPESEKSKVWSEKGWVRFRKLTAIEIEKYLASKKWIGKAGAVNVEERPVLGWITKRGGEFDAVVGLPTKRLRKELGKC